MTYKPNPNYGHPTKVTLPAENTMHGQWPDKKEQTQVLQIVAIKGGKFYTPVTARFFMGRSASSSVVYCSFWSHTNDTDQSYNGHGQAGGYGYHKASEALARALDSAGIGLDQAIGGVGDNAMGYAMEAIARKLGFRKFTLVTL